MTSIRIGTAGATLARARAGSITAKLAAGSGPTVEIVPTGDDPRISLAAGDCDLVVSAIGELPVSASPGVAIAAVLQRADARDALCARDGLTLATLPGGARVGVDSALRRAQLEAEGLDVEAVDVKGDVESRLALVATGELDAVILSAADLDLVGRLDAASEFFELDSWPTAPGQGVLVVESRVGEEKLASKLNHARTRTILESERGLLALLGAVGAAPIAANAFVEDGLLYLSGRVYATDGSERLTASHAAYVADSPTPAADVAQRVAAELLDHGAADLDRTVA
jgi:hydroxymethylbilane synthase